MDRFTWGGYLIRLAVGFALVFATYNPEGYSYYRWALQDLPAFSPLKVFAGVVLVIGWVIYLRASIRSLGPLGLALTGAFFASLVWLVVKYAYLPVASARAISYVVLSVIALVLSVGVSWSHISRRITGQVDADEIDER